MPGSRRRQSGRTQTGSEPLGLPAALRAVEQQVALTCIARERGRALELRPGPHSCARA